MTDNAFMMVALFVLISIMPVLLYFMIQVIGGICFAAQYIAAMALILMYCVKPLDRDAVLKAARETGHIVTLEEHSVIGGLGSLVCQTVAQSLPCPVRCLALPDDVPVAGTAKEVLSYYGLEKNNVAKVCQNMLSDHR